VQARDPQVKMIEIKLSQNLSRQYVDLRFSDLAGF